MSLSTSGDQENARPSVPTTVVAIDRDKNSQQAVKWAVDRVVKNNAIILVHVKSESASSVTSFAASEMMRDRANDEIAQLFLPYRGFCARKAIRVTEVVLEDSDVPKALVHYIKTNSIHNTVLGASSRNALTKKFRNPDVPSSVIKLAPDFCMIYVVCKGKPITVRPAKTTPPSPSGSGAVLPPNPNISASPRSDAADESIKTPFARTGYRGSTMNERSFGRNVHHIRQVSWAARSEPNECIDSSRRPPKPSGSCDSLSENLDLSMVAGSVDFAALDNFSSSSESPKGSLSPCTGMQAQRELEAEMRRLKLELKQTMEMYSTACKEAISARQKAEEFHQWKLEEARRFEEAKHAEEMALALAEVEKAKCKAALETAVAAQRIAEQELIKRLNAEKKAKQEAEEKHRAVEALSKNDIRCRKYSIEDIEIATDYFSKNLKIGEGGYGPVYKACLDHTPVAIKVLRQDAAQGKKQFLQEVEVLSRIRHPNMVLLLGACPEYGCLVYEYMDNGSLEDRLFRRGNTPPIPWSVRFKIAAEIATGLLFLHQAKPEPLVHRDLKPANILLDRNYVSKISDVGLSRLVPPTVADQVTQYRMTATAGTFCYIDPEYQQTGMLGTKSDIYSLGIMLLQIITAKRPMGLAHQVERAIESGTFTKMLDSAIDDWPVEETLGLAKLALKCAELRKKDRPALGMVVLPELKKMRNLGHAYEADLAGSGRDCGSSSFRERQRPRSVMNQEMAVRNPWKSEAEISD